MSEEKRIEAALISVFDKDGLEPIIRKLHELEITLYSTGGTERFIRDLGIPVVTVESLTSYPSILGGRVKTLHPKVFGGILSRRKHPEDILEVESYELPSIDLVIVDLYPFEKTVASGGAEQEIIEKIDIGGISLIRAAAKNFEDVLCVPSKEHYPELLGILNDLKGYTSINKRKQFATYAFKTSSHYDTAIYSYFSKSDSSKPWNELKSQALRYGENPHQKGFFLGEMDNLLEKLHGKELSYNNLLDIDAAVGLMSEFVHEAPTFAILKHNNACGVATREVLSKAYIDALASDPVSAFGGILICNRSLDIVTAEEVNKLFCEVVIAPNYEEEALKLLMSKKNRILLRLKSFELPQHQIRSCLNGYLHQDRDHHTDTTFDLRIVTDRSPTTRETEDLLFASKICKHTKSNTIVLAKNKQLLASGTGQTSRVDALKQAIHKAQSFQFDLNGAVMASDAFFPFPDCVEIAHKGGIEAVIQPGGSIKDQLSVDYCNENKMAMAFTGIRHFKH